VMVGTTGPIGSGLPQFGFPRRFAMRYLSSLRSHIPPDRNTPFYRTLNIKTTFASWRSSLVTFAFKSFSLSNSLSVTSNLTWQTKP
jgi:hypothetical protein